MSRSLAESGQSVLKQDGIGPSHWFWWPYRP